MKCQKLLCIILAAVLLSCSLCGCGEDEKPVSVQQVSMLMDTPIASVNRYGGVVVSQEATQVFKNESGTIAEMLVKEGDLVQEGDALFTYDMADIELTIKKAELEVEQIGNSIDVYAEQITQLEKERESATTTTDRLSYTVQIQDLELSQKEAIYNLSVKKTELETLRASAENNEVTAPVTGYVRSINLQGGTDEYGQELPTLTLVQSGAYRVKGLVNELNRYELTEGMPVIIRSRVDDTAFWRGSIETILWDEPESAGGDMYGFAVESTSDGESMTDSNNYPFYVTLEDTEGLMLGEHIYIEPDFGQEDDSQEIWVEEGYVILGDSSAYVWVASKNSTLQKREVTLGTHDTELGRYVITEGLSVDDYIAWPEAGLAPGMSVVYYDDSTFDAETSEESSDDMPADDVPTDDMPNEDVPVEGADVAADDVAETIVEE